jgi:hypothetical protein
LYGPDSGPGRADFQLGDQILDHAFRPFHVGFHPSIVEISYSPDESTSYGRMACEGAVTDTLNMTGDHELCADAFLESPVCHVK